MDFSAALAHLRLGRRIHRRGWRSPDTWLSYIWGDRAADPYIRMNFPDGRHAPWCATHADLLGTDWEQREIPEDW